MKPTNPLLTLLLGSSLLSGLTACQDTITEFGFDGAISGTIKDPTGASVAGSTTNNNLTVQALGAGDKVATIIPIRGDGTYQNTKLYPKPYRIWVSGPVTLVGDTLRVDFATEKTVAKDLIVTPFLSLKAPVAEATTATSVTVGYEVVGNSGKVPNLREVYCSTIPYPDTNTGAGPYFDTKKATVTTNKGSVGITGLTPKTTYYVRVGARATGATAFNFSPQIKITTP